MYHEECSAAALANLPRPPVPEGLDTYGINSEFISSMVYSVGAMLHTYEASMIRRGEVHSLCQWFDKPSWFLTVNPDDGCSIMIVRLVTCNRNGGDALPSRAVRYKYVSDNPGAASLAFEDVMFILHDILLGWDSVRQCPKPEGGVLGYVKAAYGPCEEQQRLTLHEHLLVWCFGHNNLSTKLDAAFDRGDGEAVCQQLSAAIDGVITASFQLPAPEMATTKVCFTCNSGQDSLTPVTNLKPFRSTRRNAYSQPAQTLRCSVCRTPTSTSEQLDEVMRRGYCRLFDTPSLAEVATTSHAASCLLQAIEATTAVRAGNMNSTFMPLTDKHVLDALRYFGCWSNSPPIAIDNADEQDRRALLMACITCNSQTHDDGHRKQCEKQRRAKELHICRYSFPKEPQPHTTVTRCNRTRDHPEEGDGDGDEGIASTATAPPVQDTNAITRSCTSGTIGPTPALRYLLQYARNIVSLYTVRHLPAALLIWGCNNNLQYVLTMTAAYYVAKYSTKSTKENAQLLDWMLRAVLRKLWQLDEEEAAAAAASSSATVTQ